MLRWRRVEISGGALLMLAALYYLDGQGVLPLALLACALHEAGHWLAIRALGGRDIRRANWQTGLQAAAEEANCVFVSPCLDGFVLVIGLPRFPEQGLAGAFRQVQAFATHRVTEYHAWARWDSGTLERMYVYDGSRGVVTVQTGELTAQEIALGFGRFPQKGREDRCEANPTEEDVLDLAAAWGVDPRMEAAAYPPSAGWICTVR